MPNGNAIDPTAESCGEPVTQRELAHAFSAMTVKPGDVVVVRYLTGKPTPELARSDYEETRAFFARQGIRVRILQTVGNLDFSAVTEEGMAKFGWVKKR